MITTRAGKGAPLTNAELDANFIELRDKEHLAAIAKQVHKGAVVDVFVYDTSKDSDGGAWRNRCRHTTWENEALVAGKWQGIQSGSDDDLYGRGVRVGDYFQYIDGVFYIYGVGPVYRGNTREFPAMAVIVAESGRVVIYDGTKPELPMWMVFLNDFAAWNEKLLIGGTTTCVTALNGKLYVGQGGNAQGLVVIDFVADQSRAHSSSISYGGLDRTGLARRNSVGHTFRDGVGSVGVPLLGNNYVLDVAAKVLSDAPVEAESGLPTPTVLVGTVAGATVLKHDGTVFKWLTTDGHMSAVDFGRDGGLAATGGATVAYRSWFLDEIGSGTLNGANGVFSATSIPARWGTDGNTGVHKHMTRAGDRFAIASDIQTAPVPLILFKENQKNYGQSMVAGVHKDYTTGWLVGDNRAALLASAVAETLNGANKVTNSNFATGDLSSINEVNGCVLSVVSGKLRATKNGTNYYGEFYFFLDGRFIPGRTYTITFDYLGGDKAHQVGIYQGGGSKYNLYLSSLVDGGARTFSATFVAEENSKVGIVFSGIVDTSYAEFDTIEIREADPDRSVKGRAMTVFGSVTKTPVAAGADLMSYGGFSSENYLEQPWTADLNFGTGDFYIMMWIKKVAGQDFLPFVRADATLNQIFHQILASNSGSVSLVVGIGTDFAGAYTPDGTLQNDTWSMVTAYRRSGFLGVCINGKLASPQPYTAFNLTHPSATLRVAKRQEGYSGWGGQLALLRYGATVPSDDQIMHIYQEELKLFQLGAKCTLYGTDQAIGGLAYDDSTNLLHVSTYSGYRSAFCGLVRAEGELTGNGTVGTRLSAAGGALISAGLLGATFTQPSLQLRDELRRRAEARRAMAREEIPLDFDGAAAQTQFPLPIGFTAKGVWVAGSKKRRGATKDYTVTFDGYRETVVFGVSPGATWVNITANRSL